MFGKIICSVVLLTSLLSAQSINGKNLIARKLPENNKINIDGEIEPVWATADSVSDFVQFRPNYGLAPTEKTIAKVLVSKDALYVLMIAYDNSGMTDYKNGIHDDNTGDRVSISLDTFNDKKTAYKFAVSSTGWRIDARILDDGRRRDYNWDGIWFAAAKRYDWGYAVEMKIPFKSIQYKLGAKSWGLDFDRWIPNKTEDIYWVKYSRHEGMRVSNFGKLIFEKKSSPQVRGLNLELYPVALEKTEMLDNGKYKTTPHVGMDFFYNPSAQLTMMLSVNPDFAQIEADPFKFNISRYETYYSERRPFFIEGNEIFTPEGGNSFEAMTLFYSRRIGEKLPDGSNVPLNLGAKVFGRIDDLEYGSLIALTGNKSYSINGSDYSVPAAVFGVARIKKQIYDNSTVGAMFVGKRDKEGNQNGVLDFDGSIRGSDWQIGYQAARSFTDSTGDYAFAAGITKFAKSWGTMIKANYVGSNFDVNQIGYVPWIGTSKIIGVVGPRWFFKDSPLRELIIYGGGYLHNEKIDSYTDRGLLIGGNLDFRKMWGISFDMNYGKSKDNDVIYNSFQISSNIWVRSSSIWNFYTFSSFSKTYNFYRDYLGTFASVSSGGSYLISPFLTVGTSVNIWREGKPDGSLEDLTLNTRPYITLTPVNDMRIRIFTDNLYIKSSDKLERLFVGFYFAYNFSPKSWIYFTYNELRDRTHEFDDAGNQLAERLHVTGRDATLKVKYLYYF